MRRFMENYCVLGSAMQGPREEDGFNGLKGAGSEFAFELSEGVLCGVV